jgi:hypothetical protein
MVIVAMALVATTAAQERPLPDREPFFEMARANLERSQARQTAYAYRERRRTLHTNPFGRIGSGAGSEVFEVTPVPGGGVTRQLVERDGMAVSDAPVERRRPRQRPARRSAVADTAAGLDLVLDHRERLGGRDVIVVTFAPKAGAPEPETREGRLARLFKGRIYIDEAEAEVVRVEATAIDDITYGLGFVARLNEGTTVTLVQERVDSDLWLPTSIRFVGEGRAMLVRKLRVDHLIEWFAYRRVQ